ncbi:MAG: hypothetical protein EZS28_010195 [Streblomastix strix]|uniref:Uncharacterized protein n=1 Tax=Streblomastix strix TaxID=222440 RepID=A0A5J4WHV1_9EUKA|nr:MAG: hypothetical protein EZS28_010195 [Streblomastix strix]
MCFERNKPLNVYVQSDSSSDVLSSTISFSICSFSLSFRYLSSVKTSPAMLRRLYTLFEAGCGQETVSGRVDKTSTSLLSADALAMKELVTVSMFVAYYNAFGRHHATETLHADFPDSIGISKLSLIPILKAQKTPQSQAQHISVV